MPTDLIMIGAAYHGPISSATSAGETTAATSDFSMAMTARKCQLTLFPIDAAE